MRASHQITEAFCGRCGVLLAPAEVRALPIAAGQFERVCVRCYLRALLAQLKAAA